MKNCWGAGQIYSYLEDLISSDERRDFELHIAVCPKCREVLEERRLLVSAAESLPDLELPPDFNRRVMDRIVEAKVSLKSWLIAVGIWLASVMATLAIVASSTEEQGIRFLIGLNQWLWMTMKNAGLLAARAMTFASFTMTFLRHILTFFVKGVMQFTTVLSPTIQLTFIALSLLVFLGFLIAIKKGYLIGERS